MEALSAQSFSGTLRVTDVRAENRGRPHRFREGGGRNSATQSCMKDRQMGYLGRAIPIVTGTSKSEDYHVSMKSKMCHSPGSKQIIIQ